MLLLCCVLPLLLSVMLRLLCMLLAMLFVLLLLLDMCVVTVVVCVVAGVRRTSVAGLGLSSGEDSSQLAPVAAGTSPPMQTLAPAQAAQHGNYQPSNGA